MYFVWFQDYVTLSRSQAHSTLHLHLDQGTYSYSPDSQPILIGKYMVGVSQVSGSQTGQDSTLSRCRCISYTIFVKTALNFGPIYKSHNVT